MNIATLSVKQKVVLLVAAGVVFLMLLFPPFVVRLPNGSFVDKGYGFIFSSPKQGYLSATINATTLLAQIAGVALLAGVAWMFVGATPTQPHSGLTNLQNPQEGSQTFPNATKSSAAGVPGGPPKVLRAGFWRRSVAFTLGYLILLLGLAIFFFVLGAITDGISEESTNGLGTLSGFLAYWLYFANIESGQHQATIGKRARSIKVVGLDGKSISFGRASGRHFAKILSGLTMGVGFVMCVFTKHKQCLHDVISDCLVVRDHATEQEVQAVIAATT